jgi:hypothetical protein
MLWGRSDLKEKFYSGESSASPWVRDLLWKSNIVAEKKKLGVTGSIHPIENVPPHMRSVHAAKLKAEAALKIRTMERVKSEKMLEAQIQQKLQMGGGGGGTARSKRSSGVQLPGSRHTQRARSRGGGGGGGGQSAMRLPALDLDVLKKKGAAERRYKLIGTERSRKSQRTNRSMSSSYSRGESTTRSRASSRGSMRSSASVTKLATLLKDQNEQLRRGLQQQVRFLL